MRSLQPIAESALPEPLSAARLLHQDGRRLLAVAASGRLLRLELDPAHLSVRVLKTRVVLDPLRVALLSASIDFTRLAVRVDDGGLRVLDLTVGAELFRDPSPGGGAVLLPDGRSLVDVRGNETRVITVDDPARSPPPFSTWHYAFESRTTDHGEGELAREETFHFLDRAKDAVLHVGGPGDVQNGRFRLFVGCYGFVVAHLATATPPFGRVPGSSRVFGGLVYEPVRLLRPYGNGWILAIEGSGTGLATLDPESGEQMHFPVRRSRDFIRAALPCIGAQKAWVKTVDGAYLWNVGAAAEALPPDADDVLAAYPDVLLCTNGTRRLVWAKVV